MDLAFRLIRHGVFLNTRVGEIARTDPRRCAARFFDRQVRTNHDDVPGRIRSYERRKTQIHQLLGHFGRQLLSPERGCDDDEAVGGLQLPDWWRRSGTCPPWGWGGRDRRRG